MLVHLHSWFLTVITFLWFFPLFSSPAFLFLFYLFLLTFFLLLSVFVCVFPSCWHNGYTLRVHYRFIVFKSSIHCEYFSVIVGRNLSLQQMVSLVSNNNNNHFTISNIAVLCEVVIALLLLSTSTYTQYIPCIKLIISSPLLLFSLVSLFFLQWSTLIKE